MADISKLKQLREETEVSFSLCKKALEESNDDISKAKELLKKWGVERADKKSDRETGDGGIFGYVHHNGKIAVLIELKSETDFVSGNEDFKKLAHQLAMHLATSQAETIEEFLNENFVFDPKNTILQMINDAILKFGENIKVSRFIRWRFGIV